MKVTDEDIIHALISEGLGLQATAKKFGVAMNTIYKRKEHLIKIGKIPSDFAVSRQSLPKITDKELQEAYLIKGWGVYKISKEFNLSEYIVSRRLKRLNIINSEKQHKPSGLPRRKRRPSSKEFSDGTKKKRFEEEHGICEICHNLIGNGQNYRLATYHHRKPIKDGGDASEDNCAVLHEECHLKHFQELHGFPYPY